MIIKNKRIFITGAESGIGLGTAQYCLAQGASQLFLLDSDKSAVIHLNKLYASEDNVHIIT
ncbi:hypothetical protein [Shewanella surugensis]|uniref:SDR family NAD(P)-dependent oxidoreductase n=1 Tax=Shewanella surugensis TaxID=212020 RepID=A0ABT0LJJ2_9GAMM|nr:hypothetical protein [Shewanella surugensis]MCL1127879.1 hypothetical protein [Shewanella surugensis]